MGKSAIRKGHYYAAKYRGDNGDLILGRVVSVKRDDTVELKNLLTGRRSKKKVSVLIVRNRRISKAYAGAILNVWKMTKDRQKTRTAANMAPEYNKGAAKKKPASTNSAHYKLNVSLIEAVECYVDTLKKLDT